MSGRARTASAVRRAKPRASDRQIHSIICRFRAQPAPISKEQMYDIEKIAHNHGFHRRVMLDVLTLSGAELIAQVEQSDESAATVATMLVYVRECEEKARLLFEFPQTASMRLSMALAFREDMQQVIANAEKQIAAAPEAAPCAATSPQAAPDTVPGFPQIGVFYHGHRRHECVNWIWVTYSGWARDLIAAAIMMKIWLRPTGKQLLDGEGDRVTVTRTWHLRGGKPQRYCHVRRAKPVERLDALPGARAAVLTYLRQNADYDDRDEFAASLRARGPAIMPQACVSLIEHTVADSRGAIG